MYYEGRGSNRSRRTRYEGPGFFSRLLRLVIVVVVIWALLGAGYTSLIDGGWTHILLLGVDYDENGTSRSDTMIVASVSPLGAVRLTSILRDTWVEIPGHGEGKINAAYRHGGPQLAMDTVNRAFGLNITRYAVVSFRAFPLLIDALGGVKLSVTEAEMREINSNLDATRKFLEKFGTDTTPLSEWGDSVRLTGAQAVSYARIRHIGDDYERTARQRRVLSAMLDKARHTYNPVTLVSFLKQALEIADTNVFWPHMAYLGTAALIQNDIEQLRLPAEGAYESGTYSGVWSIRPNFQANREIWARFLQE